MIFNSFDFLAFFIAVFAIYWVMPFRLQNYWLLVASYFFYGYWDPRFLGLILLSTAVDYGCGLAIHSAHENNQSTRAKMFLWLSIFVNLGILISFKVYGFFVEELRGTYTTNNFDSLEVIIPIGISFYTFQTMSYTIDIFRKEFKPTKNFADFALFVSFFPQLVAGPIERAKDLLPQIQSKRSWDYGAAIASIYLVIWGLFHKAVIADNLVHFGNIYFDHPMLRNSTIALLSTYAFGVQVYCDFAGYSYMAMGIAGLLGIKLSVNFRHPLLTSSPQAFWAQWHITLADWFRSYLLAPLTKILRDITGSQRASLFAQFVTIVVFGAWHGFAWTFLLWGVVQALFYFMYRFGKKASALQFLKKTPKPLAIVIWFHLVCMAAALFRMSSINHIPIHIQSLASGFQKDGLDIFATLALFTSILFAVEIWHMMKGRKYFFDRLNPITRMILALGIYIIILISGVSDNWSFIYFQF